MITSGTNTFMFGDGAVFIVSAKPGRCGCSRSAFLFISRNGSTHCLFCEHFMFAPSEEATDSSPDAFGAFDKAIV
jgi:hypothetical protein